MTVLWVLWIAYLFAFAWDALYFRPYRKRVCAAQEKVFESGALSFGLRASLPVITTVLFVRAFALDVYNVPTSSMEPILPKDTTIFVNRLAYGIRSPFSGAIWFKGEEPQRGDVFVFQYPREPRTTFVKRVLGLEGDRVRVEGDHIYINDHLLNKTTDPLQDISIGDIQYVLKDDPLINNKTRAEFLVPDGHYFAVGDNINHSEDSRNWGYVAERHLIGRVIL